MIVGKYRIDMNDSTLCRCGFSKQEIEEEIDKQIHNSSPEYIRVSSALSDSCVIALYIPRNRISILKEFNAEEWNDIGVSIPKEYWGKPVVLKSEQDYTLEPQLGYKLMCGYISPTSGKIKGFNYCNMDLFKYFKIFKAV